MTTEQLNSQGLLVRGDLDTANASAGVEVPLYLEDGTLRALESDEKLVIESLTFITVPGGEVVTYFDIDDDDVEDVGEVIEAGEFGANQGLTKTYNERTAPRGPAGAAVFVTAPAGNLRCTVKALIRKVLTKSGPVGNPIHDPSNL